MQDELNTLLKIERASKKCIDKIVDTVAVFHDNIIFDNEEYTRKLSNLIFLMESNLKTMKSTKRFLDENRENNDEDSSLEDSLQDIIKLKVFEGL